MLFIGTSLSRGKPAPTVRQQSAGTNGRAQLLPSGFLVRRSIRRLETAAPMVCIPCSHCVWANFEFWSEFFRNLMRREFLIVLLAVFALRPSAWCAAAAPDFNHDIRPILSDKCFRCHGPDENERKGGQNGLRLDTPLGAREDLGGGAFAIVAGKPQKSELIARVTSTDEEEIMPPLKTGKALTKREIELLRSWIASGASYAQHWSYEPPRQAPLPVVKDRSWSRGPIDQFVLARLEKEGLRPQPEADREALA